MSVAILLFGLICILYIPNIESTEIACSKEEMAQLDGIHTIQCIYAVKPFANTRVRKYCCRVKGHSGQCPTTLAAFPTYRTDERISLHDDNAGKITLTIEGVLKTDEGIYMCGLGKLNGGIKATFNLTVYEDGVVREKSQLVIIPLRGTWTAKCKSEDRTTVERLSLCVMTTNTGCMDIIDSTGKVDPKYQGRVTQVNDNETPQGITITIANMQFGDAGRYSCVHGEPGETGEIQSYDVSISTETDIPQGSRFRTSRPGGSLSAQFNYNPKNSYSKKYFCKVEQGSCVYIMGTDGTVGNSYEGRAIIHDDTTAGSMQVLMNNIKEADAGWYWCVLDDGKQVLVSTIQVSVTEENRPGLSGNKIIEATVGQLVEIECYYPCGFTQMEKYMCKWSHTGCDPLPAVVDPKDAQSTSCVTQRLLLKLPSVTVKDIGSYICGVINGPRYGDTIAVQLIVKDPKVRIEGRARNIEENVSPPSEDNDKDGTVTACLVSVAAVVVVASAVFLIYRLRKRRNSDLVSVGSYRTNISLTELDNNIGKDNLVVATLQETDVNAYQDEPKIKKMASKEELDYSCFMTNQNVITREQDA